MWRNTSLPTPLINPPKQRQKHGHFYFNLNAYQHHSSVFITSTKELFGRQFIGGFGCFLAIGKTSAFDSTALWVICKVLLSRASVFMRQWSAVIGMNEAPPATLYPVLIIHPWTNKGEHFIRFYSTLACFRSKGASKRAGCCVSFKPGRTKQGAIIPLRLKVTKHLKRVLFLIDLDFHILHTLFNRHPLFTILFCSLHVVRILMCGPECRHRLKSEMNEGN